MRTYLDFKTAITIVTSIVHSKLDYCNSLYFNLPRLLVPYPLNCFLGLLLFGFIMLIGLFYLHIVISIIIISGISIILANKRHHFFLVSDPVW